MMRFLRSAFVIARRDFGATVLSKTFIFFLLGPLFPLLLGGVFSGILNKVPCLIGCGLPNALSLATTCGIDPACWISHAPAALAGCIRQCLQ